MMRPVAQVMASIAVSRFRHTALLRSVNDWLMNHHSHVPHTSLPPLLATLHSLDAASDRLIEAASSTLTKHLHMFTASERGRMAQLVWVLGARPNVAAVEPLLNATVRRIIHHGGVGEGELALAELAQLANGMHKAQMPVRVSLVPKIAAEACSHASKATTQQLVDLVAGVSACGLADDSLMHAASARLALETGRMSAQQLCDTAVAFSRAGAQSLPLFGHLATTTQQLLDRRALSHGQVATLAWAFAINGFPGSVVVSQLLQTLAVRTYIFLLVASTARAWVDKRIGRGADMGMQMQ